MWQTSAAYACTTPRNPIIGNMMKKLTSASLQSWITWPESTTILSGVQRVRVVMSWKLNFSSNQSSQITILLLRLQMICKTELPKSGTCSSRMATKLQWRCVVWITKLTFIGTESWFTVAQTHQKVLSTCTKMFIWISIKSSWREERPEFEIMWLSFLSKNDSVQPSTMPRHNQDWPKKRNYTWVAWSTGIFTSRIMISYCTRTWYSSPTITSFPAMTSIKRNSYSTKLSETSKTWAIRCSLSSSTSLRHPITGILLRQRTLAFSCKTVQSWSAL